MMLRAGMHALLAQSGQEISPWLIVAAAAAIVLVILLLAAPLLRRRESSATTATQPPPQSAAVVKSSSASASSSGEHRALERDIQILIKELSDLTKRVNAQIAQVDERSAKLEQLVRAADERVVKLRGAQVSSNGDGQASTLPEPAPTASSSPDEIDPRHVEIYTMCEQGLSAQQIADRLHRPSGEVELIIALRPRVRTIEASRE